jgi:hypothetical protein
MPGPEMVRWFGEGGTGGQVYQKKGFIQQKRPDLCSGTYYEFIRLLFISAWHPLD